MNATKLGLLSIGLAAALAVAGCGGGGGGEQMGYQSPAPTPAPSPEPAPTPAPTGEGFTDWSKAGVFNLPEDADPVIMDTLTFNFDGNDNPNAYSDLLPPG